MLSVIEAAHQLGISPGTLRTQIKLGVLKAEKHGRDWYLTPLEVQRYRDQHLRREQSGEEQTA